MYLASFLLGCLNGRFPFASRNFIAHPFQLNKTDYHADLRVRIAPNSSISQSSTPHSAPQGSSK